MGIAYIQLSYGLLGCPGQTGFSQDTKRDKKTYAFFIGQQSTFETGQYSLGDRGKKCGRGKESKKAEVDSVFFFDL